MINPLSPGTKLRNRYQIIKLIGRGGQCIVYLTYDQFSGKSPVVKCLADQSQDPQERAQNLQLFMKEHFFLSKLDHPSLPKAYDYFQENGYNYLVVEFVPGQNLEQVMKKYTPFVPEKVVMDWGMQMAKTLIYLSHQKPNPVVIRDIKPSNVQLTPDGKIMMIDFSISREWKPNKSDTVRMGSPGYAAPEQYKGKSDIRSDIYSLGVTLYEALTKKDPSLTPFKFQPARQINPQVSEEIEKILLRAMETDVDKRYQNPKELLDDFKKLSELNNLSNTDKAKKFFLMGEQERGAKNHKKALEYYQSAVKFESNVGEYRCRLGEMYYLLGNPEIGLKEIYNGIASGFSGLLSTEQIGEIRGKYESIKNEMTKTWSMFSKNLCRTGNQAFEAELLPPMENLWQNDYFSIAPKSSPAIGEDMLFIGSKEGRLFCIDINTGAARWTFDVANPIISSPCHYKGYVYFGSNDSNVYAVNIATGKKAWSFKTDGAVFSSPAVCEDTLYIGSSDNRLYAINTLNGMKRWEFDSKSSIISSPAIFDGKIFFGTMSGSLFSLHIQTGQINWIFDTGGPVSSTPAIENNLVYLGSFDGKFYAVDIASGKLKWLFNTGKKIETNAAAADGIVYVTSSDTRVYALDAFRGTMLWQYKTDAPVLSSPAVTNKIVYVITNYLHCLNARTGESVWKMQVPGPTHSSPSIANSSLYFTSGKTLYSCGSVFKVAQKSFTKGNELFNSGQYVKAAENYRKAVKIQRKKEYLEALGKCCYLSNDDSLIDEAISVVSDLIVMTYSAEYSIWLGDLNYRKKAYDQAITHYKEAIKINDKLDWPHFRIGLITYKFKVKPEDAIAEIQKAIDINVSNPIYLKTLGEIYQILGQEGEAVRAFTRALAINPNDLQIRENLDLIRNSLAARESFELGKELMAKGNVDEAIGNFEKAITNSPPNGKYHFELALAYIKKGDDRFISEFGKALSIEPENKDYLLTAGKYSIELLKGQEPDQKNLEWTLEILRKALALSDSSEYHVLLADCLFLYGKVDAGKAYEEALSEYQKSGITTKEILYKISQCYIKLNRRQESARALYSIINQPPPEALYFKELGFLLLELKKEKESIDILKRALELEPENPQIINKLSEITQKQEEAEKIFQEGQEKLQLNQQEEAIDLFNKALEIKPSESVYHLKLGEAYLYDKKYKEAERSITKAIELSPEKYSYLILLGDVMMAQNDYTKAIASYKKAIEASPSTVEYYLKTGEAYERMEDIDGALEKFQKAFSLAPDNENIKQRIEIIVSKKGEKSWYMAGRDPARQSFQKTEKSLSPPVILRWSFLKENWVFETKGKVRSSPVIENGVLYAGSCDNNLYALDIHSGEKKWQNATGGEILSSPMVYKNYVYIGSTDNIFYTFEAISGKFLWMFNAGSPITASPIAVKDTIYVISNDGILYARNMIDGTQKWTKALSCPVQASPSAEKNLLYLAAMNGKVYAVDNESGEILWEKNLGNKLTGSAVIKDNFLYVGSWDKNLYAINKENQEIAWIFKTGGRILSSPAVNEDCVFFGSEDKKVYSIKASGGELVWEFKTRGKAMTAPAIANNLVYIGSDDGKIYALEADNGRPWEYQTRGPVKSSPAIAESMLFIGSDDGKIYSFRNYKPDETPLPTTKEEGKGWWKIF